MTTARPLLFLDVDGPLNPYAAKPSRRPEGYQTYRFFVGTSEWGKKGLRVWLNPAHGPALLALPFDLVWGTTWEAMANEYIGPAIGLPELPVVHFGFTESTKIPALVRHADGRPFAWVDDDITAGDLMYAKTHAGAPFLLRTISPRLGLRGNDFDLLHEWAGSLEPAPTDEMCACGIARRYHLGDGTIQANPWSDETCDGFIPAGGEDNDA